MTTRHQKVAPPPAETLVGHFGIRMPGFRAYTWTAAEARHIPPRRQFHTFRSSLSATLFLTPFRLRLAGSHSTWLDLPAGTAAVIPAYSRLWLDTTRSREAGHRMWVSFVWMNWTPLDNMTKNRWGIARIEDPQGLLPAAFESVVRIAREMPAGDAAFWPIQQAGERLARLIESTTSLGNGWFRATGSDAGTTDPLTGRILSYLQTHIHETFSINDVARHLHASASTIAHRFKADTGETPMHALRRIRIQQAKALLSRSFPLAAVAEQCGFCDQHHFAREFKRQEGISPSQFRHRCKGAPTSKAPHVDSRHLNSEPVAH